MTDPASPAAVTEERIAKWRPDEIDDVENRIRNGIIQSSGREYSLLMDALEALRTPSRAHLLARLAQANEAKDGAYTERNRLVAYLARQFPSGIKPTTIEGWDAEWHGCVYIDTPTGQMSWHYHDSQAAMFDSLPPYQGEWDGHTTEQKYQRLELLSVTSPTQRAQSAGEALDPAGTGEGASGAVAGYPETAAQNLEHIANRTYGEAADEMRRSATLIRAQASALAEAKKENYALMAAPNPRAFNLSQWADWLRLLRETRGYMHTCWRQHDGGDRKGRDFAEQALKEMEDRISAIVKPQDPARDV